MCVGKQDKDRARPCPGRRLRIRQGLIGATVMFQLRQLISLFPLLRYRHSSSLYNGFLPQAQAAFQAAVDVWASQFQSPVPIRVTANWTVLGPNVLGSAGPITAHRDFPGAAVAGTWFPAAIANKMFGADLTPADGDIVASFNSNFSWYYGTTATLE